LKCFQNYNLTTTKTFSFKVLSRWWSNNHQIVFSQRLWVGDLTVAKSFSSNGCEMNDLMTAWSFSQDGIGKQPSTLMSMWWPLDHFISHHLRIGHQPCNGQVMVT
jgi:hypothetical protein